MCVTVHSFVGVFTTCTSCTNRSVNKIQFVNYKQFNLKAYWRSLYSLSLIHMPIVELDFQVLEALTSTVRSTTYRSNLGLCAKPGQLDLFPKSTVGVFR